MFRASGKWGLLLLWGLTGCDSFEQESYDVTLDAAEAQAVPYSCIDKLNEDEVTTGTVGPSGLVLQQRWTIRAEEFGGTSLEAPDVSFSLPEEAVATIDDDDAPDVLGGTTSSEGPFQYVDIRRKIAEDGASSVTYVLRFLIANDSLKDDAINGYIDARTTDVVGLGDDQVETRECTYRVHFTGRRVKG